MQQKTRHIGATHLLLMVVLGGGSLMGAIAVFTDKTTQPCAHNLVMLWEGEFPEPAVYLSKDTVLTGFTDQCLTQSQSCTVPAGLYHPWAASKGRYSMKKEPAIFEAQTSFRSERNQYKKGQRLYIDAKLSQGECLFRVEKDRWQDSCPTEDGFSLISGDINKAGRHFFEASCAEGHQVWIEASPTLFDSENISRGVIQGYGQVSAP